MENNRKPLVPKTPRKKKPQPQPEPVDSSEIAKFTLAPTVSQFYWDTSLVKLIIGPVGSGKTIGCIATLERMMYEQQPAKDGIRYTRWAVIRNTHQQLKDTTWNSFKEYFGDLMEYKIGSAMMIFKHGDVYAEFLFRSLDDPTDMQKLLSLEITGAYLNEFRELPRETLQNVVSRLGRYPSKSSGVGCTHSSVVADSNAFADDHYLYELFFTADKPQDYAIYVQPPAILDDGSKNPNAENLDNLPDDYYSRQLQGATQDFVDIMLKVKFISPKTGKPVYPEFNSRLHVIDSGLIRPPTVGKPLICGCDNGRWSAFVIGQQDDLGRIVVFDELLSEDISLSEFSEVIRAYMQKNYPHNPFQTWLDPWVANSRGQVTDDTMYKVFKKAQLNPRVTGDKDILLQVEAVKKKLSTIIVSEPALMISNKCKNLIRGMNGEYSYRRMHTSNERYAEKPDKGKFSHICNSLEFLVGGTGAGRELKSYSNPKFTSTIQIQGNWTGF